MTSLVKERYEPAIRPARESFTRHAVLAKILSADADTLERFLIQFSSLGVGLTRPVENWLVRAGQRCVETGHAELGRALRGHAKQEAGHDQMMVRDTHALVKSWNSRRTPCLDAERLLARPTSPGGRKYQQLHEDTITGATPFVQIAIEFEIEMLPVQFGPLMLEKCRTALGAAVVERLSFLDEHITLDVAHSRFNEHQLEQLLRQHPDYVAPLARAGAAALDAYATFLDDCVQLAQASVESMHNCLSL